MSRIDGLLTDNPEAIAFGRGRLSALRQAGHTNIVQTYETPFGTVTVRIVGGVETISAEEPGLYLTQPLSRLHPDGLVEIDGEPASTWTEFALQPGGKPRVREDSGLVAMAVDWVSKDNRTVITYDHGFRMRHKWRNDVMADNVPEQGVCRNGVYLMTDHPVSGAAMYRGMLVYAAYEWHLGLPETVVVFAKPWEPGGAETEIGRIPIQAAGAVEWVDDGVFFGGDGSEFVVKLRHMPSQTYYVVRGTIAGDRDEGFTLTTTREDMGPTTAGGAERHIFLDLGRDNRLLVGVATGIVANERFVFAGLGVDTAFVFDGDEVESWPASDPDGPSKRIYLRAVDLRRKALAFIEVRSSGHPWQPDGSRARHIVVSRARVNGGDWFEKEVADAWDSLPDLLPDWLTWLIDSPTGYPPCFASRRPNEFALCLMPWVGLSVYAGDEPPTQEELLDVLGFISGTIDPTPMIVMAKNGVNRTDFSTFKLGEEPGFQTLPLTIVR